MEVTSPARILWVYDRDSAQHPFINIASKTLRDEGFKVTIVDAGETPPPGVDRVNAYSRARLNANFNRATKFADQNWIIGRLDRRADLDACSARLRATQDEAGWRPKTLRAMLRIQIIGSQFLTALHAIAKKAIRRLALFRRDGLDLWALHLRAFVYLMRSKSDVVITSRPATLLLVWVAARARGRRLIYYPFELYGEQAAEYSRLVLAWERMILRRGVDALITQNSARARIYAERGYEGDAHIVHNYKPFKPASRGRDLHSSLGIGPEKKIVLYEGQLTMGRGLDVLTSASLLLPEDAVMVFLGPAKRWWEDNHRAFAAEALAKRKLIVAPPVPQDTLVDYIAAAAVGVIIYDNQHLNNYYCEPGKLSDYVLSEIPVVAPDFPTIAPVIREHGLGACFKEFSPQAIASAINSVLSQPRDAWRPALRTAAPKLSWETQAPALIAAVTGASERAPSARPADALAAPPMKNRADGSVGQRGPDILILVEHVDRELDVACLLKGAIETLSPRLTVKVANFYTEAQDLIAGPPPRVVATPFFYAVNEAVLRDYVAAWPHSVFFNLAWEQILYGSQQTLKRPRDGFARDRVHHLAWSEWFKDYLVAHGVRPERVHWLGHPLYDLYEVGLRSYFPTRSEIARRFNLDPSKRWVFLPENYRWAFLTDEKLQSLSEQGADIADLLEQRNYCREALAASVRWMGACAARGRCEAILRPRPAVNTERMRAFIEEHAGDVTGNFRVLKEMSVREWIFASDLTVSSISTALIEAAIAGKPILRASPCDVPASLWYDWCKDIPVATTESEFLNAAEGELSLVGSRAVRAWAQEAFKVGGRPTEALARLLIRLANEAPRPSRSAASPTPEGPRWILRAAAAAPLKARHRLRSKYQPDYFFNFETHEKDLFGEADVRRRTRALRRSHARASAIS